MVWICEKEIEANDAQWPTGSRFHISPKGYTVRFEFYCADEYESKVLMDQIENMVKSMNEKEV